MPASSSRGVMSLRNTSACRWTSCWVRCGDQLELLADGQPVGGADGEAGALPALQPGDADHVELVEVAREDRQELHPLQQRQRLVLGELQHPRVEVEPGQLPVEEAVGRQRRVRDALSGGTVSSCRTEGTACRSALVGSRRSSERRARPGAEGRAARRSASVSTSRRSPGQSPDRATAPAGAVRARPMPAPKAGRSGTPTAVSSVVPVPWASATKARGTSAAAAARAAASSARPQRRQVGGEGRDRPVAPALRAPCSRAGFSPASGSSATVRAPSSRDHARPRRVVGHHDDLADDGAGDRGGDGVGQQGQHQRRRGRPSPRTSVSGRSRVFATASRFAGTTTDQLRTPPCEHTGAPPPPVRGAGREGVDHGQDHTRRPAGVGGKGARGRGESLRSQANGRCAAR